MATETQPTLFAGPVRNQALFSGHWLDNRLTLEPEWSELAGEAAHVLDELAEVWKQERGRVGLYSDEQGLEAAFIHPVLHRLGWKFKYQTWLRGREPDYALFLDDPTYDAALRAGRTADEFWTTAALVADAKKWDLNLDVPVKVQNKKEYPPEQIEWYLDHSRKDWGLLTNGRLWRLIPRQLGPQQRRFETYLETDLSAILEYWLSAASDIGARYGLLDDFKRFYLFFSPAGFRERLGRESLVTRALKGSSEYRLGVSEGLKGQTFEALRICIEGFLAYPANGFQGEKDLSACREQSFILLSRLLFIMFAEDRRLLPYKVHSAYTKNRSLGRLRDDISARLDKVARRAEDDFNRQSTALWDDLQDLFDLIDNGKPAYGVPAFNGGLFDADAHPFLTAKKLSDWHLARVIDHLGRAKDPDNLSAGLSRVDYRDLAIQHLGGIYEGLLELHPYLATERMIVWSRKVKGVREEVIQPESQAKPAGFDRTDIEYPSGSVYLVTDKGERRAFGSYYTPDHIVEAIVRQTLGPLCDRITADLARETGATQDRLGTAAGAERDALAAELERLQHDFDRRVLRLRVLDPSMGSGHFLLSACRYLAEQIATHPYSSVVAAATGGSAVAHWKRRVIENCLYGVDVNPVAVELAKLALWLETVAPDRPLTFLDHHLRHGDSLIGTKLGRLAALPGDHGMFAEALRSEFERKLPALLEPLAEIRRLPTEDLKQVKAKGAKFAASERAAEPFRQLADLWCVAVATDGVTAEQYQKALAVVDRPAQFKSVAAEEWFLQAADVARRRLACFHWELAFPEAFFGSDGPNRGFDAVIGNPPYEVLSEKESGRDLSALRAIIDAESAFEPSRRGKNNLYKLFICRTLDLLADGGRFGFIVPMALLGDDQAADLRRKMVRVGAFTAIDAFPQKDNPAERVFPEAKLSTAVFAYQKGAGASDRPFTSRVHPGRVFRDDCDRLTLTTQAIPLYDPNNFTIVSCDQTDWDLATRIMQTGRMGRLGEWAEFFQGEVNETNERAKGNLTKDATRGKLVTRGASICLYVVRPASQGSDLLLNVESFLRSKAAETKAYHHRHRRIGLQESSPQNNFRRIIAALVPAGEFCNHTVNYCIEPSCTADLRLILALLNSTLSDWYFRLGSTNAHVSHYQLYNLPCPRFAVSATPEEYKALKMVGGGRGACVATRGSPQLSSPSACERTIQPGRPGRHRRGHRPHHRHRIRARRDRPDGPFVARPGGAALPGLHRRAVLRHGRVVCGGGERAQGAVQGDEESEMSCADLLGLRDQNSKVNVRVGTSMSSKRHSRITSRPTSTSIPPLSGWATSITSSCGWRNIGVPDTAGSVMPRLTS